MSLMHQCPRCGWVDESQMFDVRTCHCGAVVNLIPTEVFNPGDTLTIDGQFIPIAWYVRAWHWLRGRPRDLQVYRVVVKTL